jgi:hypothetical protein
VRPQGKVGSDLNEGHVQPSVRVALDQIGLQQCLAVRLDPLGIPTQVAGRESSRFCSWPLPPHFCEKVVDHPLWGSEAIGTFASVQAELVAFAALVVEFYDPPPRIAIEKALF